MIIISSENFALAGHQDIFQNGTPCSFAPWGVRKKAESTSQVGKDN